MGDQRLRPRLRDGDRHRRTARRHVRAQEDLPDRGGALRRALPARRTRSEHRPADRRALGDGYRWRAAVARDARDHLRGAAQGEGGARRRADHRGRGDRSGSRSDPRRGAHRTRELALDPADQRPDRAGGDRSDARHRARTSGRSTAPAPRRSRHRDVVARAVHVPVLTRPVGRLGLDRPADRRRVRPVGRPSRRLRSDRTASGRRCPGAVGRDGQPQLPLGVHRRRTARAGVLRIAAVPAPVPAEGARSLADRRRCGHCCR